MTLSAGVQIEPSVLHSIRDQAVILLQIVLLNPFAWGSPGLSVSLVWAFGPWPETKARPERPSPLSQTFFTCADSSFGLLLALPFERKGKGLWSQNAYLAVKRGLLNFTSKRKKRKSQNSSLTENVIVTNTSATWHSSTCSLRLACCCFVLFGADAAKNVDGQKSALVPGALFGAGSLRIHSVLNYCSFHTLLPAPSPSALLKRHLLSPLHSCSLNVPWVQVAKTSVWSQWSVVLVHADLPSLNC